MGQKQDCGNWALRPVAVPVMSTSPQNANPRDPKCPPWVLRNPYRANPCYGTLTIGLGYHAIGETCLVSAPRCVCITHYYQFILDVCSLPLESCWSFLPTFPSLLEHYTVTAFTRVIVIYYLISAYQLTISLVYEIQHTHGLRLYRARHSLPLPRRICLWIRD